MKTKIAAAILSVLALGACSNPSEGQVYGKEYKEPWAYITMTCTMYNPKGGCQMWMPITHHVPECWELNLRTENDKWSECVSKDVYDRLDIEDTWKKEI